MATATNAFAALGANRFSRKWGGTTEGGTVDPYISGYFFTKWVAIPSIETYAQIASKAGLSSKETIQKVLRASCLAVTMPGGTVNKAEFTGLGGIKWSVPTNVEHDNTVSIKFLEFSTLPILSIMHGWVRLIRDYRTGVSPLTGSPGYTKSKYAGTLYYWTTQPDGKTIEYAACLTGVFPLKDPTDQYGGDLTTVDKLELDIDFNVDYVWHEDWVVTQCESYVADYSADISVAEQYGQTGDK
jgi:hypothetical protein